MPVLSVYYGLSSVSALYIKEDGTYTSDTFGYSYNEQLYSHFYKEEDFYHDILNYFLKKFDADNNNLSIIATGFFQPKTPGSDFHIFINLDDLFVKNHKYNLFYADYNSVFTQNYFLSLCELKDDSRGEKEKDLQSNLSLYGNIRPTKLSQYNLMLSRIWNMALTIDNNLKNPLYDASKPVLFFGEIFKSESRRYRDLSCLYILNILKNPGIYSLMIDESDELIHLMNVADFNKNFQPFFEKHEPEKLGVLINSPGETSCLIETEIGTQQLIELGSGKVFSVPLDKITDARIVIKNEILGSLEKNVTGGDYGLILDTRFKNSPNYGKTELEMDMEVNMKVLNEVTDRI